MLLCVFVTKGWKPGGAAPWNPAPAEGLFACGGLSTVACFALGGARLFVVLCYGMFCVVHMWRTDIELS